MSVHEGESAKFDCLFTGSDEVPFWGINGSYFDWSDLPPQYSISPLDFSLTIESVNITMNQIPYSCVIEGVESNIAFLYVLSNITKTNYFVTTTQGIQFFLAWEKFYHFCHLFLMVKIINSLSCVHVIISFDESLLPRKYSHCCNFGSMTCTNRFNKSLPISPLSLTLYYLHNLCNNNVGPLNANL